MSTFDRWFMGVLIFAMINFAWITFLEAYVSLAVGTTLGVIAGVAFGIWGPKKQ